MTLGSPEKGLYSWVCLLNSVFKTADEAMKLLLEAKRE
jgi:hypothetical protein